MNKKAINHLIEEFHEGNCEDFLKEIPENSIDMIITSPPYADQRFYGVKGSMIHPDNYVDWFLPKAKLMFSVLKPTGTLVLNISDKIMNGKQHTYVFELVIRLTKEIGFSLVRDYIWYNPSTPPNIYSGGKHGRTKKSHEYVFWFSKSDKWTFNLDPIRKPYGKEMKKYLEGKGKGGRAENSRPSTHSFDCEKIWPDNGGSDPGSVIEIGNTSSNDSFMKLCKMLGVQHPARYPEKLVEFFILSGSNADDIILDPFSGSGTTAVSAHRNGRKWIGIDSNKTYCELSRQRMFLEFPEDYKKWEKM